MANCCILVDQCIRMLNLDLSMKFIWMSSRCKTRAVAYSDSGEWYWRNVYLIRWQWYRLKYFIHVLIVYADNIVLFADDAYTLQQKFNVLHNLHKYITKPKNNNFKLRIKLRKGKPSGSTASMGKQVLFLRAYWL